MATKDYERVHTTQQELLDIQDNLGNTVKSLRHNEQFIHNSEPIQTSKATKLSIGNSYMFNTRSEVITVQLPETKKLGSRISIYDASGQASTYNILVMPYKGGKVQGASSYSLTFNYEARDFVCVGTNLWLAK